MSKLLWRALIASPAVVGATLLIASGSVQAAESRDLLLNQGQTATAVGKAETAEAQNPDVQSKTLATLAAVGKAETAEAQNLDVQLKAATLATPTAPEAAPAGEPPVVTPKVAQVTPAPNDGDVLNQINRYSSEGNSNSQDQVTNVSQLSDVRPTDWAYEALRSLVERYGCIAGYPDGTFRGNRAMTRYEFAAGLNACLQQIERQLGQSGDYVTKADLETLQRLVDEFRTELTALGGRVDKLEGRVAFLEDHQFSTTTKLSGEAIFALTDEFGQAVSNNTVLQDRVRLTFNTSFTGKDRLVTRLAAGNANALDPSINNNVFKRADFNDFGQPYMAPEGLQTFNLTGGSNNNNVVLDWLAYYFNFGSSKVYVAAAGGIHSDYAPTLNPYFEDYDGGNGALSIFASENPIYRIGGGAGAAISLGVGPLQSILGPSTLTIGYLAGNGSTGANNPAEKAGLFDGDYAALAQLNFNLGDRIGIGATYVHGYHNAGNPIFDAGGGVNGAGIVNANNNSGFGVVGSFAANNPSLNFSPAGATARPLVSNSYGIEAAFRLTNNISISGFGTYTNVIALGQGTGDIWTYGAGVAFSDLGKPGNVLGLFAGVEPTLRGASPGLRQGQNFSDRENIWHFEGFYKYKMTDNISVTPGVIWVLNRGQNENNPDVIVGTLRTTFTF
ncbi:iron uptake porin [Microcoleus sp. ZQ-A2]|nr:iron uptake porin [Microcoleus sp. FACHB-1]